ncbi:hypothetical protein CHUAL_011488 [Chamberlinius hualienensis]
MTKQHQKRSTSMSFKRFSHRDHVNDDDDVSEMRRERRCSSTGNMREWTEDDLQDVSVDNWQKYPLRCFNVSSKGHLIHRGDIVRYRRIRSMSLLPEHTVTSNTLELPLPQPFHSANSSRRTSLNSEVEEQFIVYIVGASNVGKTALRTQFTSSERIVESKSGIDETSHVTVLMDAIETRLLFWEIKSPQMILKENEDDEPTAVLVVYSVTQLDSFRSAQHILSQLKQRNDNSLIVLVGNKSDLVRSKAVHTHDGELLACNYKAKFIETSVGFHYNVDELLVGILRHLRHLAYKKSHTKSKCMQKLNKATTSIKKMFTWISNKKEENQTDIFKQH